MDCGCPEIRLSAMCKCGETFGLHGATHPHTRDWEEYKGKGCHRFTLKTPSPSSTDALAALKKAQEEK